MDRYRTSTHVDPEAEEFRLLNSKVEDNRRQGRIIARQVAALLRKQKAADLADAEKRHQRRLVRKYVSQMNKLANRIILFLLLIIGVCFFRLLDLLSIEAAYWVASICTYAIVFTLGIAWDKMQSRGGDQG